MFFKSAFVPGRHYAECPACINTEPLAVMLQRHFKIGNLNKQTIIINGNNFYDLETFYNEVDRVLTKDLDWQTGHNLDAFNDLLRGGFRVYEYEEPENYLD